MIWRIAWRNLWRHKTRTLIMTSAVALAYALMLAGLGISDDGHERMLREAAEAAGGADGAQEGGGRGEDAATGRPVVGHVDQDGGSDLC